MAAWWLCTQITSAVTLNNEASMYVHIPTTIGLDDYNASLTSITLLATTNSMTTAELRITIQDEDILERDEDFTIMLNTMETRIQITNSTTVVILNDDGMCHANSN